MCRIVGFWDHNYHGDYDLQHTIVAMRDTLRSGGPDDAGTWVDAKHGVALGHQRLAVLDLSSRGHQPMSDGHGRWIVHNGEVYNYRHLRKEFTAETQYNSDTDTEVILRHFARKDSNAIRDFRGMFAFAIWDGQRTRLTLVRDRMGIKPLFYYHADGLFLFASDVVAFHQHPRFRARLDLGALKAYLRFGYINAPQSIFTNARKLEAGCYLELDKSEVPRQQRYWDITNFVSDPALASIDEVSACNELEHRLRESASLRTISDVPIGIFLSGGIDSSLVTALVQRESTQRFKTFTVAFENASYNEAPYAADIANRIGTEHTELLCSQNDIEEAIHELPHAFGEPFGDPSAIPTLLVSRLARQHVTVALCGDGGDELFFGYNHLVRSLIQLRTMQYADKVGLATVANHFLQALNFGPRLRSGLGNAYWRYERLRDLLNANTPSERLAVLRSHFSRSELSRLAPSVAVNDDSFIYKSWDRIHSDEIGSFLMLGDVLSYLQEDILTKVDRTSMAVALEAREPLLDHHVVQFAVGLPWHLHYRGNVQKRLLKELLGRYLPRHVVERPKHGFSVPLQSSFRKQINGLMDTYLSRKRLDEDGLFDSSAVNELRLAHDTGALYDFSKLWFILSFEMWRENHLS